MHNLSPSKVCRAKNRNLVRLTEYIHIGAKHDVIVFRAEEVREALLRFLKN